ncbi:hypothetical protein [Streptomyces lavendulae]|uniref:hypothetical protein n=1 Tax=Streptomyces lavendulae TaxID=1914 RepID=UPI0025545A48|nr:hypothetical protein [Streptomyces lavendulae]
MLKEINAELSRPGADLDAARERLAAAGGVRRGGLADAQATVEIEGPEKLARMAEELTRSLAVCIVIFNAGARRQGDSSVADENLRRRSLEHALSKRAQFVDQARRTIDV